MKLKLNTRLKYILMVFGCVMIWGTAYPAVRWLSVSGVNAYLIVCMRVLFSFLFSCLLLLFTRTKINASQIKNNFWTFALLGICGSAGFLTLMTLGLQFTEAGKGSFLVGVNPIYIVLLSALFLGESLSVRKFLGVLLAVVGVFFTLIGKDLVSGIQIIVFLTGLQAISPSLYEAADVEGCTAWESFWKITFPMVSPLLLVNCIYTIVDFFMKNDNRVMERISTVMYSDFNFGVSSAMSWIYFGVALVFILISSFIISRAVKSAQ